jgi:hypothetical protein
VPDKDQNRVDIIGADERGLVSQTAFQGGGRRIAVSVDQNKFGYTMSAGVREGNCWEDE